MKHRSLVGLGFCCILLVVALSAVSCQSSFALEANISSKGIELVDSTPLFMLDNMAPGDTGNATATLSNTGPHTCTVYLGAEMTAGDELLYSNLQIIVSEGQGEIYKGRIDELQALPLGELTAGQVTELEIIIIFPKLGNELQGTFVEFNFEFRATVPMNGLPATGTNVLAWAALGLALLIAGTILFRLAWQKH